MSKWIFLSAPCLICLTFLAAGALSRPSRSAAATAPTPFLAQPLPLDEAKALAELDGARLLKRSLAGLRDARWLNVVIWQRLHDADDSYESEARLTLGPGHCVRMETTLAASAGNCKFLAVSDGHTLAEVQHWPGEPPRVTSSYLPLAAAASLRDQFLRKRGCAGPKMLLSELHDLRPAWQVESGVWRERSAIRLEAAHIGFDAAVAPCSAAARSCRLYLDGASLWPLRLEWYRSTEPQHRHLLLEMEFREPELNRALSREECARVFSYQP